MTSFLILASVMLCCFGIVAYYRLEGVVLARNPGLYLTLLAILAAVAAWKGAFLATDLFPPSLPVAVAPMLVLAAGLGFRQQVGNSRPVGLALLVLISSVRVPVEVALHGLFELGLVPQAMTWEGTNFDIFSGASAPFVAWLTLRGHIGRWLLVGWHLICVGLLVNVVVTGVLSAPFPFQLLNFHQPNVAVLHFPFSLLPIIIVPTVFFTHFRSLSLLLVGQGMPASPAA